ncbi:MAG: hypothetical protein B6I30_02520 [Desulfobacteraceae bacterium 4572_187]|nr:MAG: hypothetical protein B6I30_02520 [Desulfobacteraceae bacterium 4572_187]
MNRRSFLIKSAFLMAGSLTGLNSFSKAFAVCEKENNSSFQPLISIIIDDIGYSISRARNFLNLNIAITFSILPKLTNSHILAAEISEALRVIRDRDLFFIDSLTSGHSVAYKTARKLQMPTACRNIFLDNHLEDNYILRQLHKLQIHAKVHGHAIGIGHPFPETARAIKRYLSNSKHSGVSFVHISDLLPVFNNNSNYS